MRKLNYDHTGWAAYKIWWVKKQRWPEEKRFILRGDHPHDPDGTNHNSEHLAATLSEDEIMGEIDKRYINWLKNELVKMGAE